MSELNTIATDFFYDKYPYMKLGTTGKNVIICPMSADLVIPATIRPKEGARIYQMLFPPNYTYHIIGYERNLSATTTLEQTCADFVSIIKKKILPKNPEKVILVGISYGGFPALQIAATCPELVEKLVLIVSSACVNEQSRNFVMKLLDVAKAGKGLELELMNGELFQTWWIRWLMKFFTKLNWEKSQKDRYPLSTMINAYSDLLNRKGIADELLANFKVPTFILGADQDKFFAKECYEKTAKMIPNTQLTLLHGGHMAPIEHRKEAIAWIKMTLDS